MNINIGFVGSTSSNGIRFSNASVSLIEILNAEESDNANANGSTSLVLSKFVGFELTVVINESSNNKAYFEYLK